MAYLLNDPNAFLPYGTAPVPAPTSSWNSVAPTSSWNPGTPDINTAMVGDKIGQYYTGALANDPRMPLIRRNQAGQLDPGIMRGIEQAAAERGVGIGSYGSANASTNLLRTLGLSKYALQNEGNTQYSEAMRTVPNLNPESLFISPTNQAEQRLRLQVAADEQRSMRERLEYEVQAKERMQTADLAAAMARQNASLSSQASLQQSALSSQERMQGNQLGQSSYQFGVNRGDTLSGVAATNKRLDQMLEQWKGGTGGSTSGSQPTSIYGTLEQSQPTAQTSWWNVPNYNQQPAGGGDYGWENDFMDAGGGDYFEGAMQEYDMSEFLE